MRLVFQPDLADRDRYYLYYLDNVKAFPEGFQMLAGNKNLRSFEGPVPDIELSDWPQDATDQFFLQQRALGFNCLNYAKDPEPSLYRHQFPDKNHLDTECTDGLRLELAFPSCGNGEKDSEDHKSHMAYPNLVKEGKCPPGYDHHYPFLFYETIWNTYAFAGEDGQFVLSQGDPVGTGYHGDFIMGWTSSDFLQQALDTCQNESGEISDCPLFDIQSDAKAAQCTFPMPAALRDDDPFGPCEGLPVNVPVQYGPANATAYPVAGRSSVPTTSVKPTSAPSTFTLATYSYTRADPSVTSTAQLGIIVDVATSGGGSAIGPAGTKVANPASSASSSPSSSITAAPSLDSSSAPEADIVATSYTTNGNEVIEWVVQEVDVTVTATPSAAAKHRRHIHKHLHHAGRF